MNLVSSDGRGRPCGIGQVLSLSGCAKTTSEKERRENTKKPDTRIQRETDTHTIRRQVNRVGFLHWVEGRE